MSLINLSILRINDALYQTMGERWRFYRLVILIVFGVGIASLAFTLFKYEVSAPEPDQRSGAERIMGDDYYDADSASRPDF